MAARATYPSSGKARSGRSLINPSTPNPISRRITSTSFTVQGITASPASCARNNTSRVNVSQYGVHVPPPSATTASGSSPPCRPHQSAGSAAVSSRVNHPTANPGRTPRAYRGARQSNDCTVTRPPAPAPSTAANTPSTITSAETVHSGRSGCSFNSMFHPATPSNDNTSTNRGTRAPSHATCSGNAAAYALPGLIRPTS